MDIRMSAPWIDASDVRAVVEVLRSGQLALGPRAEEFERRFAAYVGTRHAVAVNSGAAGLHLAVLAAGVRRGDDVVTTPFSFIASTNCFVSEGARPVFVDVEPETLMPAARAIDAAVTRRTRAILAVDLFGNPFDADAVAPVARRRGLALIEDACEAPGAEYNGRRAGSLADAAVFGFYPNKQMTTGEGGMIVTGRKDWDALFRSLRNQGRDVHDAWITHSRVGYNYRLDELSAALGLSQLRRLDRLLEARARVADAYGRRLAGVPGVRTPRPAATTTRMSWWVYVIQLDRELDRDRVMRELEARGIPSRAYFSPLHLQPAYRKRFGFRKGQFPVTEDAARRSLALPFHGRMKGKEVECVCRALEQAIDRSRRRRIR
ncbi:MAG TPA: DegT/DnrJ/EryC1/StrS family aminotransferase [Candidatus Polarisedimenticolia bacterium]|nr:DegT/DnrJ/EryC1/StrS family aminotransferase [Candidatus Polarisedimenticolia bacterium]